MAAIRCVGPGPPGSSGMPLFNGSRRPARARHRTSAHCLQDPARIPHLLEIARCQLFHRGRQKAGHQTPARCVHGPPYEPLFNDENQMTNITIPATWAARAKTATTHRAASRLFKNRPMSTIAVTATIAACTPRIGGLLFLGFSWRWSAMLADYPEKDHRCTRRAMAGFSASLLPRAAAATERSSTLSCFPCAKTPPEIMECPSLQRIP